MSAFQKRYQKHAARIFAWSAWVVVLFLVVISFWLRINNLENMPGPTAIYQVNFLFWMLVLPLAPPAYATVAALIMSRMPENKVGWMCLFFALVILIEDISWQYTQRAMAYAPGSLPAGELAAWVNQLFTSLSIPPGFLALMLYYFPNNRLPGRAWLSGVVLGAAGMALMTLSVILTPEISSAYPNVFPNPTSVPGLGAFAEPIFSAGMVVGLAALLGGSVSVVARWRQSNGVERAQIKWLATVSAMLIVVVLALILLSARPELDLLFALLLLAVAVLVAIALPGAIGIAMLRYKLWNIDWIIRRTLAYSLVTGLLALVYFSSIVLLEQIFRSVIGDNSRLSVVISTLGIAALFNPVRMRTQMFIDRRFYRSRYDVVRMLSGFTETTRDLAELEALADRLNEVIQGSMHPGRIGVWFKELQPPDETEMQSS